MIEPKKCENVINEETQEVCNRTCLPVPVSTNIPASEWYCPHCHKSYRMDEDTARKLLTIEAQNKRR